MIKRSTLGFISVGTTLMIAATTWLVATPSSGRRRVEARGKSDVYTVRATKVVFKPWYGRHHVYGVFVVPNQYTDRNYSAILSIPGVQCTAWRCSRPDKHYGDHVVAESGHYLMPVHIPTRIALWLIFTAAFDRLRDPQNWTLAFADQTTTPELGKVEYWCDVAENPLR
jgi:hypothetical protein